MDVADRDDHRISDIGYRTSNAGPRTSHDAPRFDTLDQLIRRCGLRRDEVATLAEIGALNAFGFDRRTALWQVEQAVRPAGELFESDARRPTSDVRRPEDHHPGSTDFGPRTSDLGSSTS